MRLCKLKKDAVAILFSTCFKCVAVPMETTCNASCVTPSCANGSKIVVLRFGDPRTKEMLGVVGSKV